jgi:hypothetical protein
MKRTLLSVFITVSLSLTANAQSDHSHDHSHEDGHSHSVDFGTIDDGWLALETASAEIRATVQAGNITALRSLYDQLLAVADGLAS